VSTVLRTSPADRIAIYVAAIRGWLGGRTGKTLWLEARLLNHTPYYGDLLPGDQSIGQAIVEQVPLAGIDPPVDTLSQSRPARKHLQLSSIYAITSDSVRVFLLYSADPPVAGATGFAAEDMLLLHKTALGWQLLGRRNRMIT
jgi:hypothetical protein